MKRHPTTPPSLNKGHVQTRQSSNIPQRSCETEFFQCTKWSSQTIDEASVSNFEISLVIKCNSH